MNFQISGFLNEFTLFFQFIEFLNDSLNDNFWIKSELPWNPNSQKKILSIYADQINIYIYIYIHFFQFTLFSSQICFKTFKSFLTKNSDFYQFSYSIYIRIWEIIISLMEILRNHETNIVCKWKKKSRRNSIFWIPLEGSLIILK